MAKSNTNGQDAPVAAEPLTIDECKTEFEAGLDSLMEVYGMQIVPSLNWILVQETASGVSIGYYKPVVGLQLVRIPGWQAPVEDDSEDIDDGGV